MGGPALRWPATLGQDPRLDRGGPWAGLAYRALLELTKAQGWHGVAYKADAGGDALARHLGWTGEELVALEGDLVPVAAALEAGLRACAPGAPDALLVDDGDAWVIARWREYQLDPTAATRQRAKRAREAAARGAGHGGRARHRNGVTVTTGRHGIEGQGIPPEGPTAESKGPQRHGDGPGRGTDKPRLTPAQRQALAAAGLDLNQRHGTAWAWEKAAALLLRDGISMEQIVQAMLETAPSLPPFVAFQRFDATLRGGRRAAPAPPRAGPGGRFAGIGATDPVPPRKVPAEGTGA